MKRALDITAFTSRHCRAISTRPRPVTGSTLASPVHLRADCRASGFGGYFFPGLGGFKWPKFQGPDSITAGHRSRFLHRRQACAEIRGGVPSQSGHQRSLRQCPWQHYLPGGKHADSWQSECASQYHDLGGLFFRAPFKSSLEVGNPTLHLHNWAYGLFFQDDWRVSAGT